MQETALRFESKPLQDLSSVHHGNALKTGKKELSSSFQLSIDIFDLCFCVVLRYLLASPEDQISLYYEPHCVCNMELLKNERADIVITPVIKQLLPQFTLVSGQEDAVQLAKILKAK